ncbi:MAG: NAD(P)-dependent oxidoreductase [Acidimicrobiales bacterium]|nr:NAD(P)-dependent oxidoreductase [Acidimicrobiales bacterium]
MKVGFIGLGNVGAKLSGSLLRNGFEVVVRDLNNEAVESLVSLGAQVADSPKEVAQECQVVVTCLPSPAICAEVMEGADGVLAGLSSGKLWLEMSTTDEAEVRRLGALVEQQGALALDCPVSGGCHRAATGNIAILAGGNRKAFEQALPVLSAMGRQILHTGDLGSASLLKVMTNFLATANLVSLSEALATSAAAGLNLNVAYEAIRISSGNSFVHETESQVILNGSRDINFTMGLVAKDIGLFDQIAQKYEVPLELSPLLVQIFEDGRKRYGDDEWSPNIVRRLEEAAGVEVRAPGFPAQMIDDETEAPGVEIRLPDHF